MRETGRISDAGVSPVIGVMLMIVVTIIIAAVVSAFAGGLSGDQKKVPVAQFDMRLYANAVMELSGPTTVTMGGISYYVNSGSPRFDIIMINGEPIPPTDLKFVTYRTDETGAVVKHEVLWVTSSGTYNFFQNIPGWNPDAIHPGEMYYGSPDTLLGTGGSGLAVGTPVEIDIVHIPTNTVIYTQEVRVQ
jgi:FlaG/FlaF family flagellin (archaellin)